MIRPWFRQAAVPWKTTVTQTRASGENRVSTKLGVLHTVVYGTPSCAATWFHGCRTAAISAAQITSTPYCLRRSIESGSSTRDTPHPAHSARRGRTRPIPPPSPTRSRSTPNPHRASRPPHPGSRHRSSPDPSCASTTATT